MSTASPGRTWRRRWNGVSASRWVDSDTLRRCPPPRSYDIERCSTSSPPSTRLTYSPLAAPAKPVEVVRRGCVGAAEEHDLGEMVREYRGSERPGGGVELCFGLPDRDEQ